MTQEVAEDRPDLGMMIMVHRAFARDLSRLDAALAEHPQDPDRVAAIDAMWQLFNTLLEHHHQAEDQTLWPTLLEVVPDSHDVIERMEAQHDALDAFLSETGRRMARWCEAPDAEAAEDCRRGLRAIGNLLDAHLVEEEQEALSLVGENMTTAQWRLFTSRNMELNRGVEWTMAWLADGKSDQVRGALYAAVPGLDTARAASDGQAYASTAALAFGIPAPKVGPPAA